MFDRFTTVRQAVAPSYPQKITIQQPSTKQDLETLRDMEQEFASRILGTVDMPEAGVRGVVVKAPDILGHRLFMRGTSKAGTRDKTVVLNSFRQSSPEGKEALADQVLKEMKDFAADTLVYGALFSGDFESRI